MSNDAFTTAALLIGGGLAGFAAGRWMLERAAQPEPPRNAARRSHRDVEFAVDDAGGAERIFKTFDEAAGFAVGIAVSTGRRANVDVLVSSRTGARWWGGDDAVQAYDDDPEASVFERIAVTASSEGRVA